jgi:hypothetical protein
LPTTTTPAAAAAAVVVPLLAHYHFRSRKKDDVTAGRGVSGYIAVLKNKYMNVYDFFFFNSKTCRIVVGKTKRYVVENSNEWRWLE